MLVVWWYSLRTIHWTFHGYEPALLQPCIEAQAGATEKHLTWDVLGRDNGGLHLRDIASEYGRRGPCSGWYAQIERNPFHHVLQVWMASGYLWFKEETSLSTERTPSALILHTVGALSNCHLSSLQNTVYGQLLPSPASASPRYLHVSAQVFPPV